MIGVYKSVFLSDCSLARIYHANTLEGIVFMYESGRGGDKSYIVSGPRSAFTVV